MSRTISTNTTGPVVLGTADNPLSITSTGTVASAGSGVDGIDGGAGTTWTITNAGKVSSSGGNGVSLAGRGVIRRAGLGKSSMWPLVVCIIFCTLSDVALPVTFRL